MSLEDVDELRELFNTMLKSNIESNEYILDQTERLLKPLMEKLVMSQEEYKKAEKEAKEAKELLKKHVEETRKAISALKNNLKKQEPEST